ncbi:MAG: hypothetical protein ABI305_13530, partial [Tepidiformaceae bacterium]
VGERPALLFPVFAPGLWLPQYEKCRDMMGDPPSPAPDEIGGSDFHYEVPISEVERVKMRSVAAHRSQLPGGDTEAIFPPGIIASLMQTERFLDANGRRSEETAAILRSFTERA